ncbi:hypothetical protein [Shinella sp. HZN7]|uniref:hypothetical protein n=1 Tax=Shinella sp. (strain HZN7) TaxID=879274 RepID=UPI0007DAB317|nr:hypothetical protein [Shinella sp. HZN7]ANH05016.1 hypothetical protein shn_13845 [Shinella sp. HZN7]
MTSALSEKLRSLDIRATYKRPGRSVAHWLDGATDADIRNLVEGYRTEAEVIAEAERSFDAWWGKVDEVSRLGLDGFSLWRAYKAGYLSMARETGQLPSAGAT